MSGCSSATSGSRATDWNYSYQGPGEDCLPYNPQKLQVEAMPQVADRWRLTDGIQIMAAFDSQVDANNALALAQRYRMECYIGRHTSTRTGERPTANYGVKYWKNPTGVATRISPEQCTSYTAAQLAITDHGADGWVLTDQAKLTIKLDNRSDAEAALVLARQHSSRCVIGQEVLTTDRLAPGTTRLDYWK